MEIPMLMDLANASLKRDASGASNTSQPSSHSDTTKAAKGENQTSGDGTPKSPRSPKTTGTPKVTSRRASNANSPPSLADLGFNHVRNGRINSEVRAIPHDELPEIEPNYENKLRALLEVRKDECEKIEEEIKATEEKKRAEKGDGS